MNEVIATRVAVLGVEGDARAQLRRALSEFGADIAIEGDPRQIDPQSVSSAAPSFILVSLDEAIEDALDAYQDIFDDPRITVIFDEAAVTRELGGWELARWARHLASKLLGDQSAILPAAPANAARVPNYDLQPQPGAPISPEQAMRDARLEDYTHDTVHLARDVPINEVPGIAARTGAGDAAPLSDTNTDTETFDAMALELNSAAIEIALRGRAPLEMERAGAERPAAELDEFSLDVDLSALAESAPLEPSTKPSAAPAEVDIGMDWAALEAGFGLDDFSPATTAKAEPTADAIPSVDIAQPLASDETDLDADLRALEASLSDAEVAEQTGSDDDVHIADNTGLQLEAIELADDAGSVDEERAADAHDDASDDDGLSLDLLEFESSGEHESVNFSSYSSEDDVSLEWDPALVEMAAALDAHQAETPDAVVEPDFAQRAQSDADIDAGSGIGFEPSGMNFDVARAETRPAPSPAGTSNMFANLELAPADDNMPAAARQSAGPGLDVLDFDALVAGLSLVEADAPSVSTRRGVVVVFAGTGGPDAVRQVLSRLPAAMPVPVLVIQRLDAGNHDRLVPQLAKVCPLQVMLAEAGRAAAGGAVAVLPGGVGLDVGRHGDVRFALREQSTSELLAQLAAFGEDLVVVIASGADPEISEALSQCMAAGAAVIGQEPSSCFDCAAADQVKALGGRIGSVGELTAQAIARWGS